MRAHESISDPIDTIRAAESLVGRQLYNSKPWKLG